LALFIKEVIKGSIRIGYDIITPKLYAKPGIIAIPLDAKTDLEITLLANSITLTPGTTSLAVSTDKSTLYVYSVYIDKNKEQSVLDIKNGLEKKLLEALR
jgi:multicomponent Na+:H+ antiporter subunit E